MANVMKKDPDPYCFGFFGRNLVSLGSEHFQSHAHQMHRAQRMMKPGVVSARVNIIGKPKLGDPAKTLEVGMFNEIEDQLMRDTDKTVNGVIENLVFVDGGQALRDLMIKLILKA